MVSFVVIWKFYLILNQLLSEHGMGTSWPGYLALFEIFKSRRRQADYRHQYEREGRVDAANGDTIERSEASIIVRYTLNRPDHLSSQQLVIFVDKAIKSSNIGMKMVEYTIPVEGRLTVTLKPGEA